MPIPLQADCDPNNPEEAFLWMLVSLPGLGNAPLILPDDYLRQWSRRLWMCGARFDPEQQKIEYHTKAPTVSWIAPSGKWVPVGTPPPPHMTVPDVKKMEPEQQQEILRQFTEMGVVQPSAPEPAPPPVADGDVAEEVTE